MKTADGAGEEGVSVVVVNWNSGRHLADCLESVFAHGNSLVRQVVVVDNASDDGSLLAASAYPVSIVKNYKNEGFAAACNQGAALAVGEFILFLNPDVVLKGGELAAVLDEMADPAVGVVGVALKDSQGERWRSCARDPTLMRMCVDALGLGRFAAFAKFSVPMVDWAHDSDMTVDHVIGAFYLIRTSIFRKIGEFDSRYFVYYEDLDLSRRVRAAGLKIRYLAGVSCTHIGGGSSSSVLGRRLFYSMKSKTQYVAKWGGGAALGVYVSVLILLSLPARLLVVKGGRDREEVLGAYRMYWDWFRGWVRES